MTLREQAEKAAEEINSFIDKPGEHWFNLPRCPHCGASDEYWWDGNGLQNDDDTTEMTCGSCEKPYTVTLRVSYEFKTEIPEGGAR